MRTRWLIVGASVAAVFSLTSRAVADPVPVRHTEGLLRGFLALNGLDGKRLASGDLAQNTQNDRVTNHLTFRFKDGSVHDETAVFSQRGSFRLLSYHLVQKGPTFKDPVDVTVDAASGRVKVLYNSDGKPKEAAEQMDLPADLANGLVLTLLKNVKPAAEPTVVSMLATTPKPMLVKLSITSAGEEVFSSAGFQHKAIHYIAQVKIGGVTGVAAKVLGKVPPPINIWIAGGEAPGFVKMEGPLFYGGPIWRIEFATPAWPVTSSAAVRK